MLDLNFTSTSLPKRRNDEFHSRDKATKNGTNLMSVKTDLGATFMYFIKELPITNERGGCEYGSS